LVTDIGCRKGIACGVPAFVDYAVSALGRGRQTIGHGTPRKLLAGLPRPGFFLVSNLGDFRRADMLHNAFKRGPGL
ncbi:hypothetical protein SJ257_25745, partial [Citrobacter freundii]|nr:hypothetical protein [Citrobacter freundii]